MTMCLVSSDLNTCRASNQTCMVRSHSVSDGRQDLEKTAFDDEAERRKELAEKRREEQVERLRDAYNSLKYTAVMLISSHCCRTHPRISLRGPACGWTPG